MWRCRLASVNIELSGPPSCCWWHTSLSSTSTNDGATATCPVAALTDRLRLPRLLARPIRREARRLAQLVESEVLAEVRYDGQDAVALAVDPAGRIRVAGKARPEPVTLDGAFVRLCRLLTRLGVERVELDPRLTWGQIYDVLMMLHGRRGRLAGRLNGRGPAPWLQRMTSPEGPRA